MIIFRIVVVAFFLLAGNTFSQLAMFISTDKETYKYGEKIELICRVTNTEEKTFKFTANNHRSCHAHFQFNNFDTKNYAWCMDKLQTLVFQPFTSLVYTWIIDPVVYGLPNNEGTQQIIGSYYFGLTDTIYITAPQFLGGQFPSGGYPVSPDSSTNIMYII